MKAGNHVLPLRFPQHDMIANITPLRLLPLSGLLSTGGQHKLNGAEALEPHLHHHLLKQTVEFFKRNTFPFMQEGLDKLEKDALIVKFAFVGLSAEGEINDGSHLPDIHATDLTQESAEHGRDAADAPIG